MNNSGFKFGIIFSVLLLVFITDLKAEINEPSEAIHSVKSVIIPCKDLIDDGLYKSIKRRSQEALDMGAEYLIYEIQTYGGLVQAADDISKYLILKVGKKAKTIAYVTTEAISAGAMISVSCQDIIMLENTTIGDAAPIMLGGKLEGVEREKQESFVRATFKRAAQANNYPEALLKAMVTVQTEVYRIRNVESGEYEFFENRKIPTDPNKYDIDNKELIVKDDELLTLTASDALEYGIARAVVDDEQGVLSYLADRDGVTFSGEPIVLKTIWSEEMVRWINSPMVMGVLVMVAFLGIYIELNTPGVGLPGLAAVICFTVMIGSKYLIGLANWVEVALFVTGLILLSIEIFVLPGFGIAGSLGIICILGGLFGMLIKNPPGKIPWPQTDLDWKLLSDGAVSLTLGFIGFVVLAWLSTKYLPKMQFLSGLILLPGTAKKGDEVEVSMTSPTESQIVNIGDIGEVIMPLRPTGKARFGEAVVDCLAQAEFLDKGTKIEIIQIHGNKVTVKAAGNQE